MHVYFTRKINTVTNVVIKKNLLLSGKNQILVLHNILEEQFFAWTHFYCYI